MKLYQVVQYNGIPFIAKERCLLADSGDYVGINSGETYFSDRYKELKSLDAKIVAVDEQNNTGMLHLFEGEDDKQNIEKKNKFIGCYVTVRPVHLFDGIQVYYCYELEEYFSEYEIEIL